MRIPLLNRKSCLVPLCRHIRIIASCSLVLSATALAAGQSITFIEKPAETQDSVRLIFRINGASDHRVRVSVWGQVDHVVSKEISLSVSGEHIVSVNIFEGYNRVSFIVYVNDEAKLLSDAANSADIKCTGRWCKKPFTIPSDKVASEYKESASAPRSEDEDSQEQPARRREANQEVESEGGEPKKLGKTPTTKTDDEPVGAGKDKASKGITIDDPKIPEGEKAYSGDNSSSVDAYLTVTKDSEIAKIQYDVFNGGTTIFTSEPLAVDTTKADAKVRLKLKFAQGLNTISIFNAEKRGDGNLTTIDIDCEHNCASDLNVATIVTSSQNTRVIVGIEQAGAASTDSKTKPFLDLYFTTPFHFGKNKELSRLGLWGNIRLASTPDQITATGILPSNLINQVGQSSSTTDLVQSFDFLAGIEGRVKSADNSYLGLIPGVRQRTHFYLAAGFGAISPLTAKKELAEIFELPKKGSPQYDAFVQRYGTPDSSKEFIGFVPLDRDRFLRQWYAGFRFKTLYCEDRACNRYLNRFPAIVDFMFGQSEAVTGGRLKYDVTTLDPATNTQKIIGQKNAYVFRLDAFYPLPIREASFIYLYGTAIMKVGGGGVRIENPIFLNRASGGIQITDPKVFIPPPEFQQLLQPNRDYYKIGVGLNLTDLFNRRKSPQ